MLLHASELASDSLRYSFLLVLPVPALVPEAVAVALQQSAAAANDTDVTTVGAALESTLISTSEAEVCGTFAEMGLHLHQFGINHIVSHTRFLIMTLLKLALLLMLLLFSVEESCDGM
jgi:hypothetical protein